MVGPVRSTPVGPVGAIGGFTQARGGSRAGGTMRRIANRVADRLAREFRLYEDQGRGGGGNPGQHRDGDDPYAIRDAAHSLSGELDGKPADEGRIARSLSLFAQESASLMAARPEAASLETIARVIALREASGSPETIDRALLQIDQTTRDLAEDRLR